MKKLVLCVLLLGVCFLVGCGGSGSSSGGGGGTTVTLIAIQVTPATPSINVGATQQFKATGAYSDGTQKDITTTANWLSSSGSAATINTSGLATAVAIGTTTISATSGTISGNTTLTVVNTLVSIAVTPATPSIAPNSTQQFTATGTYASGPTQDITASVTWQSSSSSTASISAGGLATGVAPGTVTITATSGNVSGTTTLTVTNPLVSIAVTPANSSVAPGIKPLFTATGTYFDHTTNIITTSVTWSSSNTAVATISNAAGLNGQATAVAQGNTTITATSGSITGSTTLTVTNATVKSIAVTPASAPISLGVQQQYTATGTYSDGSFQDITNIATWTSSDTTKVTITASGLATGVNVTTAPVTITATYKGISGIATVTVDATNLISIAVTPNNFTLAQGTSRQFAAVGTFSNGGTLNVTNQVTWTSSKTSLATVGKSSGLVKAATSVPQPGTSTLTATLGSISQTATLNITNATPTFITVTPIAITIAIGAQGNYTATGTFSDGTTQDITLDSTWTSSAPSVATVTYPGRLLGASIGTANITATFGGTTSAPAAQITVTSATLQSITVVPSSATLAPGSTLNFQAIGHYSDGTSGNLYPLAIWSSSPTSVLQVANSGQATGSSAGSATLTAAYQGIKGTAIVIVTPSPLVSIAVTPIATSVPEGVATQFTATGTFADTSTQNLTQSVTWASSQPSVGTISNAVGRQGLATGVAPGTTNVSAVFAQIASSAATLTVDTATLQSIAVTPSPATVAAGSTQNFVATGKFSDGSSIDLTSQVTWTSSAVTVATINGSGQASAASAGTTNITASFTQGTSTTVSPIAVLTVN